MSVNTVAWYRRKSVLVPATVLSAAALLGVATQTWFQVTVDQGAVRPSVIALPGTKVSAAVTAYALVAAAGALAAAIAGRTGRRVAGMLVLLAALGATWSTGSALLAPQSAVAASVSEELGLAGLSPNVQVTALLPLAVAAALLLVIAAVAMLCCGPAWASTRKYGPGRSGRDVVRGHSESGGCEQFDEIDGWDRLSRGEDPTVDTLVEARTGRRDLAE